MIRQTAGAELRAADRVHAAAWVRERSGIIISPVSIFAASVPTPTIVSGQRHGEPFVRRASYRDDESLNTRV